MGNKSNLELEKQRLEGLLKDIRNGTSFFGKIPTNIGEIVYCNTTGGEQPKSNKQKILKTIFGVVISLAVAIPSFVVSAVFGIIISILAVIVMAVVLKKNSTLREKIGLLEQKDMLNIHSKTIGKTLYQKKYTALRSLLI